MSEAERNRRLDYRKIRKKWIALQASILVVVILITLVSTVVFFQLDKTHYINYSEQSVVDYGVYLKENEFFTEKYLGKDQAYVASLIDRVNATFQYELFMEKAQKIDFQYSYQIDAVLEIKDNQKGVIYRPTYEILPVRSGARTGSGLIICESVQLDYGQYNDLASRFITEFDLKDTNCNILLKMNVNVIGASDSFSNVKEENSYTMELKIPLTTKTVNVNMTSDIEEGMNKILTVNNNIARLFFRVLAIVFLCVSVLLSIEIIAFIYLTRNTDITYEIRVARLVKSYKSFIQRINNAFNTAGYQLLMVDTFGEMLEIRDTIQSPILMNENADKTCTRFLIPTNTKILYVYELKIDDYDQIYGVNNPEPDPFIDEDDELEEVVQTPATPTVKIVEKPVVVTVEKPIVQFVEKPVEVVTKKEEPVAVEPAVECVAPAVVPAVAEAATLLVTDTDEDDEGASEAFSTIRRSFMAKLIQSTDDRKKYFSEIKNELLSYKGVKARTSWNLESFNKGRTHLAKVAIKGKTVCLYLALNPVDFIDTKYFYTDVSDKTQFRTVPMMVKVKSSRGVKYAKELIEALATSHGLVKLPSFTPADYVVPYQTTEELIELGLIKCADVEAAPKKENNNYGDILDRLFDSMINDVTTKLTNGAAPQLAQSTTTLKVVEAPAEKAKQVVTETVKAELPDGVELLESVSAEDIVEALKAPDVSLSEIDYVDRNEPEFEGGVEVVDVVWKEKETQNELHRYDPNGAELNDGDIVLVPAEDAAQKREIIRKAAVARGNHKVDPASVDSPLKRIIGVIRRKMQDAINSNLD